MTLSHFLIVKQTSPSWRGLCVTAKKPKPNQQVNMVVARELVQTPAAARTALRSCAWSLGCFSLLWSQKAVISSGPLLNPGWLRVYVWHTGLEINPSAACRKTRQMCIVTVQFPPKPQDAATPQLALCGASSDLTKHVGSALCLAQEAVLESRWPWRQRESAQVWV